MRVFSIVTLLLLPLAGGCRDDRSAPDRQAEWRAVLEQKAAAANRDAPPEERQRYADSVRAFVEKHPDHGRAREVWHRLQLEFADELMEHGRPHEAVRFYRAVLLADRSNEHAARGWAAAAERLAIAPARLAALTPGMAPDDVEELLGRPMPGWTQRRQRRGATFEAWYFRTTTGGVAGVYFRDGRMIAAEKASDAKGGWSGL